LTKKPNIIVEGKGYLKKKENKLAGISPKGTGILAWQDYSSGRNLMAFIVLDDEGLPKENPGETRRKSDLAWDDYRSRRKQPSFFSLAVKTLISFLVLLLCSTGLTMVMPPGFRGAGLRFFQSAFQGRTNINPAALWKMEPGGDMERKLAEVASLVPFTLKFPTYLPGQAVLKEISLFHIDNFEAYFVFYSALGNFTISYRDTNESSVNLTLGPESIAAKEVFTNSLQGVFVPNKEGMNLLSLIDEQNIHILIYGQIEENELIKIANSLR
jgi:hypothetical protein